MCGRYTFFTDRELQEIDEIIDQVSNDLQLEKMKAGEIFPTNVAPVLLPQNEIVVPRLMTWGFPNFHNKGVIINARSETVRKGGNGNMDLNRYLQEVCRLVKPYGIETQGIKDGTCYFSYEGAPLFHVASDGWSYYRPEHLDTHEKKKLCGMIAELTERAKEYIKMMENAAPLRKDYKLPCEYGNLVLAGKDMGEHGYQFATWQYACDQKGITLEHYYINDYAGAKEDFAVRSGLISRRKQFPANELNIQSEKPIFCVRIMVGHIKDDTFEIHKDAKGELLIHELMLPATNEELQVAYDFRAGNVTCYQTVQGIRYPLPVGAMAAADLKSLNDSAIMIDQMNDVEIADLWASLAAVDLKDENELKEICEAVLGSIAVLELSGFSQ